ncbi:HNH endonuclease [Curtobacterium flaccumfaciens]|uniref:HNH endonuclease n=1 Tax=Curtobacterium flaccumfaciens TaxID=2035 RepID=UPI003557C7A2
MIGDKRRRPTATEEARAYAVVTERNEERCQRCHRDDTTQRDHRKNRSQGGRTVASNLHLLCPECHLWKMDHPVEAAHDGWGMPGWADPLDPATSDRSHARARSSSSGTTAPAPRWARSRPTWS